ncbi:MAG: hypothetical protein E7240_03565 [Lachnospiraceae bacterium]|nr:hypothetical protein [Lachnospiraceae bacterium]
MMDRFEALDHLLTVFNRFYSVNKESPAEPFAAEAVFHLHNENYFLLKSAKYAEQDSNEYVFFALAENLTPESYKELEEKAWAEGLSRTEIKQNHRNSDVSLYILSEGISPETIRMIKKTRLSKSYRFGFYGYSHFRVISYDPLSNRFVHNYMGDLLARTIKIAFPDALSQQRC